MQIFKDKTKETDRLISLLNDKLKNEENFYSKLVTYTDVGMFILDEKTGKFLYVNPGAERIYNRTADDLLSKTLYDVTHIDFIKEEKQGLLLLKGDDKIKTYKMAKVFIVGPENKKEIAFMELADVHSENNFILGIVIKHTQLSEWVDMTSRLINV